ncbi:hypothetical protein QO202_18465 [Aeromonas caviae]|uniref:hypothetical protein n=1 Tax=Aeromonas caviae TaxID=648 RepID=UPI002647FA63|nr:hypothetical protein [Aeromonas caviae]MDN6869992.1 hypothetical protein [Aeromonas caviae]
MKIGISISYVLLASFTFLSKLMGLNNSTIILISVSAFTVLISITIYWYLQVSSFADVHSEQQENEMRKSVLDLMIEIRESINLYALQLRENILNDNELTQIDSHLSKRVFELRKYGVTLDYSRETLTQNVMLTLFMQFLDKEIGKLERIFPTSKDTQDSSVKSKYEYLEIPQKLIEQTTRRINFEIQLERRRATIYIMFGSIITMIAGYMLYESVQHIIAYQQTTGNINIESFLIRFSIVIFIEVFAFYYLRLYSRISDNIKFYQNEMTNIETKSLCFYALKTEEITDEAKNSLLSELLKTERNFVIDKNKTTVDIERAKLDSNILNSTISGIAKLTRNLKG